MREPCLQVEGIVQDGEDRAYKFSTEHWENTTKPRLSRRRQEKIIEDFSSDEHILSANTADTSVAITVKPARRRTMSARVC